jgi:hypothetical protein
LKKNRKGSNDDDGEEGKIMKIKNEKKKWKEQVNRSVIIYCMT